MTFREAESGQVVRVTRGSPQESNKYYKFNDEMALKLGKEAKVVHARNHEIVRLYIGSSFQGEGQVHPVTSDIMLLTNAEVKYE